jgi:hypothetical protein
MTITQVEFKCIIEALRDQYDYDKARSVRLSEIYGVDVMPSDNSRLINVLFRMLHGQFPPKADYCPIQAFCWELDFGRSADIEKSDSPIDELWETLQDE